MYHKHIIPTVIYICAGILISGCSQEINISHYTDKEVRIYPDYKGVTIPANIAPLNFYIEAPEGEYGAVISCGGIDISVLADDGNIDIPMKKWQEVLQNHQGDSIKITVCKKEADGWSAFRHFSIEVSADTIDPILVYRKIPPLYGVWKEMGIYQRNLTSYDEKAIYENKTGNGNCVNCHSFDTGDPNQMSIHLRGQGGGTYIIDGDKMKILHNTKTDSTIASFTYPYHHPNGRYIAYSVNNIFQVFHTSDTNVAEVIDDASDIIVFDKHTDRVFSSPNLKSEKSLETFPAFSADGKALYFCTAVAPDSLPQQFREVRYTLCSIPFDAATGRFGHTVDTLTHTAYSDSAALMITRKSISFPRPSPDGKWIAVTASDYGNFSIWHHEADLWIYDIHHKQWRELDNANSPDTESYHSWSSNSKWMVVSSRRENGLYTYPYIVHIDPSGYASKPFLLPQRKPKKYYADINCSFNIPEFVKAPVNLDSRQMRKYMEYEGNSVKYAQ